MHSQCVLVSNTQSKQKLCLQENSTGHRLKKKPGVHAQPWLRKRETSRVAQVEPPAQDVKY